MIRNVFAAAGLAVACLAAMPSHAEDWTPTAPVTLQIGFGAGGGTDTLGRAIAAALEESRGWDMVVENKPGGGGVAMFSSLVGAAPDGQILGMGVTVPTLMGIAARGDTLPFDNDSFDFLATVVLAPVSIVAPADAPYDTFADLVAYAAENDGANIGFDAGPQAMIIKAVESDRSAGLAPVPHNSGAELIQSLLGGSVDAAFLGGAHIQYVNSGDLKMLAVVTDTRHAYSPDTTSLIEQGFPYAVEPYFYLAAPKGLPTEVRETLAAALDEAIRSPAVTELVTNMMKVPPTNIGPDGTAAMMKNGLEITRELLAKAQ